MLGSELASLYFVVNWLKCLIHRHIHMYVHRAIHIICWYNPLSFYSGTLVNPSNVTGHIPLSFLASLLICSCIVSWSSLMPTSGHKVYQGSFDSQGSSLPVQTDVEFFSHFSSYQSRFVFQKTHGGTSLVVQRLKLCSHCGGPGFAPWSGN